MLKCLPVVKINSATGKLFSSLPEQLSSGDFSGSPRGVWKSGMARQFSSR
jgi:hypothetical protein